MRAERIAFAIGLAGCVGALIGLLLVPHIALTVWLAAFLGWSEIVIGCLAMAMMVASVPGAWRPLLAPPLAAGASLLPLLAFFFLPVLIGFRLIYPWAAPHPDLPAFKALWLSPTFWILRAILIFVVLIGLQRALAGARERSRAAIAALGLILYALIGSMLGIDWAESIEPQFHSSIYGLIFLSGQWLGALAFALALALPGRSEKPPFAASGPLITALLFWGYIQAMQYIVIWSGDIPAEAHWYLERDAGIWSAVTWAIVFGQGVLPFLALCSSRVRESNRALTIIAIVTLAMRLVETAWLVLPPAHLPALPAALLLAASWAGMGGLGSASLLRGRERAAAAEWNFVERKI
ncbi:MAG TPA: hypothetical protein VFW19_03380 [Allosphingosinicella sp.]|nr:hypothetical protein [Allosphingosinicella sp.]